MVEKPGADPGIQDQTAAEEINRLHRDILEAGKRTFGVAIEIGRLLSAQKKTLGHGRWLPWLEDHIQFTSRTATNYMRLFENRDKLKSETISDLAEAYRVLAHKNPNRTIPNAGPPKQKRPKPQKPEPSSAIFADLDLEIEQIIERWEKLIPGSDLPAFVRKVMGRLKKLAAKLDEEQGAPA
jgi:hypothetical protein